MCPVSGLVQFLIVLVTLLLVCHALVAKAARITFKPQNVTLNMYDTVKVEYNITATDGDYGNLEDVKLYVEDTNVAYLERVVVFRTDGDFLQGSFNLTGNFLGRTLVYGKEKIEGNLDVTVVREKRVIDTVFTASVATLVSIIYINFGCALNWGEFLKNFKRPIGPAIGLIGQFLIMPLLSFGLGMILFPDSPEMQLGLFFTGVSPAGGASNVWTAVLEGNIDLSITMTTISTHAAFGMMPLWIFTLGEVIFDKGKLDVPYKHIATYAGALVVPLAIGYLISRYLPRVGQFLARILKGFSSLLVAFIIVFAIITNLYLFKLFSWKIVLAGMGLPYLGYGLGYILAKSLKQPPKDCLTIAIETGIQNTGIAIFLLRFALPQPQADLTTVAPVAVAIMTPFPLLILYIYNKIQARLSSTHKKLVVVETPTMKLDDNFNSNTEVKTIS